MARSSTVLDRKVACDLGYVEQRYRDAVAAALGRAINDLAPRERLLLAYYYYDEMTLREIGQLFDVHEATISRWLAKVHKRVRKLVEKGLAREHGFNRREITEAIEMAAEQLDLTVGDYLLESVSADRERERTAPAGSRVVARR
jgi:predicted DNA-binding protein YlxM (UPF0122 family)